MSAEQQDAAAVGERGTALPASGAAAAPPAPAAGGEGGPTAVADAPPRVAEPAPNAAVEEGDVEAFLRLLAPPVEKVIGLSGVIEAAVRFDKFVNSLDLVGSTALWLEDV